MTNRMLFTRHLMSLLIVAVAGSWASAGVIDDYEADTPETAPTGPFSVIHVGSANTVKVVDDGTISTAPVVDPFGSAGNQSLMIEHAAGTGSPKVLYDNTSDTTGNLTFSSDFFIEKNAFSTQPYIELRIGDRGTAISHASTGDMAVRMRFWDSKNFIQLDYGGSGFNTTLDNPLIFNTAFTLTLEIDTVSQTFTGDIDGTPLTDGGGAITTFGFQAASVTQITGVEFVGAWNANGNGTRFYVDDVSLSAIPEPSSLGLLCLGVFVTFTSKARKFTRG